MKVPIAAEVGLDFNVIHDLMPNTTTTFYDIKLPFTANRANDTITREIDKKDIYHT